MRASGKKALVGQMLMSRVGRAAGAGRDQGSMSVLIDAETKKSSAQRSQASKATKLSIRFSM